MSPKRVPVWVRVSLVWWCLVGTPLAVYGSPIMPPFSFSNDFDLYGRTQNFTCPVATDGVCAAIAAINSFVFLQNQHPDHYDELLVPNGDRDPDTPGVQADVDAENFATAGWQVPGKPARLGYYERTGDPNEDYLDIKMEWFGDFAPGKKTRFSSMFGAAGLPSIEYLAREIKKGEDIEFFVKNVDDPNTPDDETGETFYHALTLFGIGCDAAGNCHVSYQDPNDPATPFFMIPVALMGGRLEFNHQDGGRVFIDAAFSESAPEPSLVVLVAAGIVAAARRSLRGRHRISGGSAA